MRRVLESLAWGWVMREAFGAYARAATARALRRLRATRAVRRARRAAARYLSRPDPPPDEPLKNNG